MILVLVFIGQKLTVYAPLVPKTIQFMDDVHNLNNQAPEYKKTADELQLTAIAIKDKITELEKRFNWFKQEMERQRR